MDDYAWKPHIRAVLHGLGLHKVLEARRLSDFVPIDDIQSQLSAEGIAIVPFLSGNEAESPKAQQLRDMLYSVCEPPGEARYPLYDSLVEAFTNAVQHAYPSGDVGDGLPRVRRWWAGALVDRRRGLLHLVVYDQGVGIPATLPRRDFWSIMQARLPETSDAAVIAGALEYGRSGTNQAGRGNGLWRMCELTAAFPWAAVRFTSARGDVSYSRDGKIDLGKLQTPFCGTMITWQAAVSATEAGQ